MKNPNRNPQFQTHSAMDKKAADGMFFEKRAQSAKGRFFQDLEGRDDGMFMAKSAQMGGLAAPANAPAQAARAQQAGAVQNMGAPMGGGQGFSPGMTGGLYGTGKGMKKKAGASPTDWNSDSSMPTGFHRPTHIQPESLEAGGERFHATESNSVVPEVDRQRHSLVEGGRMSARPTSSPQMGKQAFSIGEIGDYAGRAANYVSDKAQEGASYIKRNAPDVASRAGDYAAARGREIGQSLKRVLPQAKEEASAGAGKIDETIRGLTTSPVGAAMLAAAGLGVGMRGLRGIGGLGARLVRGKPKPPAGLLERARGFFSGK
jgi:hypothetical protein